MSKKQSPPGLFGTDLADRRRPDSVSTDTHTRTLCRSCSGRGHYREKDGRGVMQKLPCQACGGGGVILRRRDHA